MADPDAERIVGALFDSLVRVDEQGDIVPSAAESWEILDDGRRFRFSIADGSFHDGSPVTAASFKRAFDAIADGRSERPSYLAYLLFPVTGAGEAQAVGGGLSGVRAEGDHTLVIELDDPQPGFLTTLAHPSLVPLPELAFADPDAFAQQPVGNGPFAMIEPREPGAFLRLTANPEHPTPPLLDEVVFQIYADDPDREGQWADLNAGLLQVSEVAPERLQEAATTFGRSVDGYRGPGLLTGISSTVYLYGFDTTSEPYDDPVLRRAISLAIDRERLATEVMQGTRVAAEALVPPSVATSLDSACDHCRHDPAGARALMARTETVLQSLTITHIRGRTHAAIAESMALDIESALGIDVELRAQDLRPFVRAVRAGEVPFFWLGWEASEPGAGAYLYPLFHSSQLGADNVSGYEDPEVDRLLDRARSSSSAASAAYFHRRAERAILADAPMLPLLWHRHGVVVTRDVRDLYWSPLGRVDLSVVWLADRS